uniref:Uncharacterized protein n=1 Tax=Mycena chlorophos TaxID=658473 RepID=A0ABQ0L3T2_MYCCL|nr:predicted protein [Mycena chlorophos]
MSSQALATMLQAVQAMQATSASQDLARSMAEMAAARQMGLFPEIRACTEYGHFHHHHDRHPHAHCPGRKVFRPEMQIPRMPRHRVGKHGGKKAAKPVKPAKPFIERVGPAVAISKAEYCRQRNEKRRARREAKEAEAKGVEAKAGTSGWGGKEAGRPTWTVTSSEEGSVTGALADALDGGLAITEEAPSTLPEYEPMEVQDEAEDVDASMWENDYATGEDTSRF